MEIIKYLINIATEIFNKISKGLDIYSTLTTLVALILLVKTLILDRYANRKIRRIFEFGKEKVIILIPTRGDMVGDSKTTVIEDDFVTFDEAIAASVATSLATKLNNKVQIDVKSSNVDTPPTNNNLICIGGPLANKMTGWIFEKYFDDFKIGCPKDKYLDENNKSHLEKYVYYDEEINISTLSKNGKIVYSFNNTQKNDGYICIMWVNIKKDFKNKRSGNCVVLFGNNAMTTRKACSFFNEKSYIKNIYPLIKKVKKTILKIVYLFKIRLLTKVIQ